MPLPSGIGSPRIPLAKNPSFTQTYPARFRPHDRNIPGRTGYPSPGRAVTCRNPMANICPERPAARWSETGCFRQKTMHPIAGKGLSGGDTAPSDRRTGSGPDRTERSATHKKDSSENSAAAPHVPPHSQPGRRSHAFRSRQSISHLHPLKNPKDQQSRVGPSGLPHRNSSRHFIRPYSPQSRRCSTRMRNSLRSPQQRAVARSIRL